jgi:hypothetical protein
MKSLKKLTNQKSSALAPSSGHQHHIAEFTSKTTTKVHSLQSDA